MRVIAKNPAFPEFHAEHPDAEEPLLAWYRLARKADWTCFADVRQPSATASQVGKLTVFNIGGHKYRLITHIRFDKGIVYIRAILTHADYDRGLWREP